jgi:hypothetical protein
VELSSNKVRGASLTLLAVKKRLCFFDMADKALDAAKGKLINAITEASALGRDPLLYVEG